jgi:cytoplasmic iron level regulating protein YaaA (DUF328/UPF0246 family)
MIVYLVACSKQKIDVPKGTFVPARELYCASDWFRKASALAEYEADEWFILSAVYGLVDPDEMITTYDLTLYDEPVRRRRMWASAVIAELDDILDPDDTVVILAGEKYREFIEPALEEAGIHVEVPMQGMQIGEQKSWLKKQLQKRGIEE